MPNNIMNPLVNEIKSILDLARNNVARVINKELLMSYWKIGEIIIRYEQNDSIRAEYGEKTLKQLSKELTKEFGRGFSVSNLQFMRRFYLEYQIQQTVSVWNVSLLVKATMKLLEISTDNIDNSTSESRTVKAILGNLHRVAGNIAEKRRLIMLRQMQKYDKGRD